MTAPGAADQDPVLAGTTLASPWRRVGGYVVDTLVEVLVVFLVQSAVFLAGVEMGPWAVLLAGQVVWLGIQLRLRRGQTFGMQALGMHARRADGSGLPGLRAAAIRWAVPAVFAVTAAALAGGERYVAGTTSNPASLAVGVVGIVVVYAGLLVSPRRQGLHDRLSGVVIAVND